MLLALRSLLLHFGRAYHDGRSQIRHAHLAAERCPPQRVRCLVGGESALGHQDALGLRDDLRVSQTRLQSRIRGVLPPEVARKLDEVVAGMLGDAGLVRWPHSEPPEAPTR
jgi:hypothetical protein